MSGSETLRFDITGNATSATRAFKDTAEGASSASRAAKELSDKLALQSKTAQVSAQASIALAKSDKILRDAELELSGAAEDARVALAAQGRAAEEAAAKTDLAGAAAKGAGGGFGALGTPLAAAVGAGVALAPVLVTVGTGLAGLGVAAYSTVSPILQASSATGGLQKNLGTLAPVQQQMARQLLTLEGVASAFSRSLQPQVVKIWGDGLSIASSVLKDIQPVAKATGDGLHWVLSALNADLKTTQWQDFFNFMAQNAGPDIKLVGDNLLTLINLMPQLLTDLQPLATGLLQVTNATGKLAGWLQTVEKASFPWLVTEGKLASSGDDAAKAMAAAAAATARIAKASTSAASQVGTLSGDMAILDTNTSASTLAVQAFNDEWKIFVGASVSDQQAVLNVAQAFDSYSKSVKQGGRTSVAAQQAFLSIFDTIKAGLDSLQANGASVSQLNGFYQTSISRLDKLHSLTPQQRADVAGLTRDYDAWANSVLGLSGNVVKAVGSIRDNFLGVLSVAHRLVPQARDDASRLADAILKTGDSSRATAADRQRLIDDLARSGLSAADARQAVLNFQGQVDKLHGKAVDVSLTTSGSGQIVISGTGISSRFIDTRTGHTGVGHAAASGWYVSGGTPGKDSVPVLAQRGELIVPTSVVASGAVDHLRGSIPGFAGGGVVGKVAGAEGAAGTAEAQWGQLAAQAFAASAVAASRKAAAAAAAASAGFAGGPAASGSAAAAQAFAQSILPGGWSWPALLSLWNQESGWNAWAVNPSSGAYGIPQSLGHGHPYNLGDYANQVRWGISYIAGRYGSSQGAWAHEQAFNWYGGGLDATFGKPTIIGVGERGREHVTVTPAGREPSFAQLREWLAEKRAGRRLTAGQLHDLHVAHEAHLAHLARLPRLTVAARPPQVLPAGGGGGGTMQVTVNISAPVGSKAELENWLVDTMNSAARKGRLTYALRQSPSAA